MKSVLARGHYLGYKVINKADSKCHNYDYLCSFKYPVYLNRITVFNCTLCSFSVMGSIWQVWNNADLLKTSKRIYWNISTEFSKETKHAQCSRELPFLLCLELRVSSDEKFLEKVYVCAPTAMHRECSSSHFHKHWGNYYSWTLQSGDWHPLNTDMIDESSHQLEFWVGNAGAKAGFLIPLVSDSVCDLQQQM